MDDKTVKIRWGRDFQLLCDFCGLPIRKGQAFGFAYKDKLGNDRCVTHNECFVHGYESGQYCGKVQP